jgi:hypothetical protein
VGLHVEVAGGPDTLRVPVTVPMVTVLIVPVTEGTTADTLFGSAMTRKKPPVCGPGLMVKPKPAPLNPTVLLPVTVPPW